MNEPHDLFLLITKKVRDSKMRGCALSKHSISLKQCSDSVSKEYAKLKSSLSNIKLKKKLQLFLDLGY